MSYEINKTPTGYTVVVDGKLRGSRLMKSEAEHIGRLHTDEEYQRTYKLMQRDPKWAVELIQRVRRRKDPKHYLRRAGEILYETRGMSPKHLKPEDIPRHGYKLSWERAQSLYSHEDWRYELLSHLKRLQRYFKEAEDEEARQLVYQMAQAIRHNDKQQYDNLIEELLNLGYGEVY